MFKRTLKYKNTIVSIDGKKFRSKKEGAFYQKLRLLEKTGDVIDIKLQVAFKIPPDSPKFKKYLLDFQVTYKDGSIKYIDVKGFRTELYKLKKLLVEHFYSITISEV